MNEARGAEAIRAKNVLYKHSDRPGKRVQGIVEGHHTKWDQMREESLEICLGTLVAMIAVNPQKPDGTVPGAGHIARVRYVRLHVFCDARVLYGTNKIRMGRCLWIGGTIQQNR